MNNIIFKSAIVFSLSFTTSLTYSQTIIRSSINCFGSSYIEGSLLIRQTAGQSANTESFSNGQLLRQGFQQPIGITPKSLTRSNITLSLFPNPATINAKLTVIGNLSDYDIIITDITGRRITVIKTNSLENNIDCTKLPLGICLVSVIKDNELLATTKLVIIKQ